MFSRCQSTLLGITVIYLMVAGDVHAAAKPPATLEQMWAIIQQQQKEIEKLKQKADLADAQKQELETLKAQTKTIQEKQQQVTATGSAANSSVDERRKTDILADEVAKLKTALVLPETKQYKSQYGLGPAASAVYGVNKGLSIGGYGEMTYTNYASDKGTRKDTADMERLVKNLRLHNVIAQYAIRSHLQQI